MPTNAHHKLFEQLDSLTFRDFRSSERLASLLQTKLGLLDSNQVHNHECGLIAQEFRSLVQDVLSNRYQDFPIRAFAHIAVALDYFLDPLEETPDHESGGFEDDLRILMRAKRRFGPQIERYQAWKRGAGADKR